MTSPLPLNSYRLTDHARQEMERRQITENDVAAVLANPGQMQRVRAGRVILQSRIQREASSKPYLLRVIVDIDRHPSAVVSAYWTSKVEKYWKVIE